MSILDSIRKLRDKAAPKNTEDEAELDLTATDVLTNPEYSSHFSDMLAASGRPEDEELAKHIHDKTLDADTLKLLNERRVEFVAKWKVIQSAEKMLSPDFMTALAKLSGEDSEFSKVIAGNGGSVAASELFKKQIHSLAINHPAQFARISAAIEERKAHHAKIDARVKGVVKKYGFSEDKYATIMALDTPDARYAGFRTEIQANMGTFGRLMEKATFGLYSRNRANLLDNKEEGAMNKAYTIDREKMREIGGILAATVSDNEELRTVFSAALIKESAGMRRGIAFNDLGDIKIEKIAPQVLSSWPRRTAGPARTAADRDTFVENWFKDKEKEFETQGGVFASIAKLKLEEAKKKFDKSKLAL